MKLQAKFERKYRSAKGSNVFVYGVTGSADALEAYKNAQGANYRTNDNGKPIYFSNKSFGLEGQLLITNNGNVIFDDTRLAMTADMIERFSSSSPLVAKAMAEALAKQLLPQMMH
jgi:hypothetical protein